MSLSRELVVAALAALGASASAQQTPSILWEVPDATETTFLRTVAWSPVDGLLAVGAGDVSTTLGNQGELTLWNAMTGEIVERVLREGILRLNDVVFHPSGNWVFTAEGQGPNSPWATHGRSSRFTVPGLDRELFYPVQSSAMVGIEISPDGNLLARAQWGNPEVWIVDAAGGQVVLQWPAHTSGVSAVQFSPDGLYLATGGAADNTVRVWRLSDQTLVREFPPTGSVAYGALSIAFSPDGTRIAAVNEGYDQRFRMWRIADGQLLFEADPANYIADARIRFTANGQHMILSERSSVPGASWMGRIRFLSLADLQVNVDWQFTQGSPNNGVADFDLSPDGQYIAFVQRDGVLTVAQNPIPGIATSFCPGDGTGGTCPCQNPGATGHGCANEPGSPGGRLSASGSNSVGAADLVLHGTSLEPNQFALAFQGTSAVTGGLGFQQGDGLLCVGGNVVRSPTLIVDGSGRTSTGFDIVSAGNVSVGSVRMYQIWYRNTATSPCGVGSNLTNALEVTWQP